MTGSHLLSRAGRLSIAVAVAIAILLAGLPIASAASPPSESTIVEGFGVVTGSGEPLVTLGMTRQEIADGPAAATNGNCDQATTCSFRPFTDEAAFTVTFDASDQVSEIKVIQGSFSLDYYWPTAQTGMVIDFLSLEEVRALYPGSVIADDQVIVANLGYTYHSTLTCYAGQCSRFSYHIIYPGSGGVGEPPVEPPTPGEQAFVGDIVVENPGRRARTFVVALTITDPVGVVFEDSLVATIPGSGELSITPEDYFDEGTAAVGTYEYSADLYDGRGRLKGTSSGTFQLIVSG